MEILKNFGIQPVLLAAQIVNFLIILYVLRRFFYKPITKALNDRKEKIAESLKNAEEIERKLAETEDATAKILEDVSTQAKGIIDNAKQEAQRINTVANTEARIALDETIQNAQEQIRMQKMEMKAEIESETITLVSMVVKKILSRSLKADEKKLITAKEISEMTKGIHGQ